MEGVHGDQHQVLRERGRLSDRYSRQIRFGPIGPDGQQQLARSRALLVGVGALGSHVAETLVRAGVGHLTLVDRDVVELHNLQRQVLFDEEDALAGRPKAMAAAEKLLRINSSVKIEAVCEDFRPSVFESLGGDSPERRPELILDGTDNFATRYLLNDLAMKYQIPWVYGGVVGSAGMAMAILPGETPCLRCLLPQAPATATTDTCETVGVIAPAVAMVAAFQAAQALKILSGNLGQVTRGLLTLDLWGGYEMGLRLPEAGPSAHCETCKGQEYPALEADWFESLQLCGRDAVQVHPRAGSSLDLEQLAANLDGVVEDLELSPQLLRFSVEGCRFSVFAGGRALIFGLGELARARILYDRYVGA